MMLLIRMIDEHHMLMFYWDAMEYGIRISVVGQFSLVSTTLHRSRHTNRTFMDTGFDCRYPVQAGLEKTRQLEGDVMQKPINIFEAIKR